MAWIKARWNGLAFNMHHYYLSEPRKKENEAFGSDAGETRVFYEPNAFWAAFDEPALKRFGRRVLERALETNFLEALKKDVEEKKRTFLEAVEKIVERDLSRCSNEELASAHRELGTRFAEFMPVVLRTCDSVGIVLPEVLRTELSERTSDEQANAYAAVLLAPTKPSFVAEEQRALAEIALLSREDPANARALLEEHARKYWWVACSYANHVKLGVKDFEERMLALKNQPGEKIRSVSQAVENKEEILAALGCKEGDVIQRLAEVSETFIELQDCRKAANLQLAYAYHVIFTEAAKRFGIAEEELWFTTPEEFEELCLRGTKPDKRALEERRNSVGVIEEEGFKVYHGEDALRIKQEVFGTIEAKKELRGTPASPGIARGTVKVLMSVDEASNFKQDEVLVASHTTPDYVIVMKKAKAILMEHGGITSHAALVSRELRVPCIVGIKNVTEILKDGNLVEVDATNGIVRWLEVLK